MELITITGRQGSGKSRLARQRYEAFKALGVSVAMLDTDSYGDFYSDEQARIHPDVKIVTRNADAPLCEISRNL